MIALLIILIPLQFSPVVAEGEQELNRWGYKDSRGFFEAVDENDECPRAAHVDVNIYNNNFFALQECYATERMKRAKVLNDIYTVSRAHLSPKDSRTLRDDQMRWHMRFGAVCDRQLHDEYGSPPSSDRIESDIIAQPCPTWQITQRIDELKEKYAAIKESIDIPLSDQDFGLEKCLANLPEPENFGSSDLRQAFNTRARYIEGCYQSSVQKLYERLDDHFNDTQNYFHGNAYKSYLQSQKDWIKVTATQCHTQAAEEMYLEGQDAHLIWLQCRLEKGLERLEYFERVIERGH